MKGTFLANVEASVRSRLELRYKETPLDLLKQTASSSRKPGNFLSAFPTHKTNIIAEIKYHSPTHGAFAIHAKPAEIASEYLHHGASAVSILTEPVYFRGGLYNLAAVRSSAPHSLLLMKDFVIDEYQLYEAVVAGADSVLLIVALLSEDQIEVLYSKCLQLGITPLVEVHNEFEMAVARALNCKLVGVNNRSLNSLAVSLDTSQRLIGCAPPGAILISESGIGTPDQIIELEHLGYRGFLIGSSFMKGKNPGVALATLLRDVERKKNAS